MTEDEFKDLPIPVAPVVDAEPLIRMMSPTSWWTRARCLEAKTADGAFVVAS
jgi:hypothetical protein